MGLWLLSLTVNFSENCWCLFVGWDLSNCKLNSVTWKSFTSCQARIVGVLVVLEEEEGSLHFILARPLRIGSRRVPWQFWGSGLDSPIWCRLLFLVPRRSPLLLVGPSEPIEWILVTYHLDLIGVCDSWIKSRKNNSTSYFFISLNIFQCVDEVPVSDLL